MHGRDGTSGVDWAQATKVGYSLLLSPLLGFVASALLLLALKALIKRKDLYEEPNRGSVPPWWIRSVLVLTCTGVSFAHGSNDGQKGMGLIMLILVGTVPPHSRAESRDAYWRRGYLGLPVSTTHVLSSGVAGTTAANRSGLQWGTIRNLLMAWILTLLMAIVLSGGLYWLFTHLF